MGRRSAPNSKIKKNKLPSVVKKDFNFAKISKETPPKPDPRIKKFPWRMETLILPNILKIDAAI